jgi:hypothetical protein
MRLWDYGSMLLSYWVIEYIQSERPKWRGHLPVPLYALHFL